MELNKTNFADKAEQIIKELLSETAQEWQQRRGKEANTSQIRSQMITSSQLRSLLQMSTSLHNRMSRERSSQLSDDLISDIQYTKMRFAYAAGRDPKVKAFVQKAELLDILGKTGSEKENLSLFCKYMESLVAYHKFYIG